MAYSYVSFGELSSDATTRTTLTATLSVTAGDLIVVPYCYNVSSAPGQTTATITDSAGNAYTRIGSEISVLASSDYFGWFYAVAAGNASLTFTLTLLAAKSYLGLCPINYSGIAASPLNVQTGQSQAGPGTATDAITSGSVSTTAGTTPCLVLAASLGSGSGAPNAGTGFTSRTTAWSFDNTTTGTPKYLRVADKRITSNQSIAGLFTAPAGQGAESFTTVVAAFMESVGGGGTGLDVPRNMSVLQAVSRAANF